MVTGTLLMQAEPAVTPQAAPRPASSSPRRAWVPCVLAACLSGGLLYACHHPLAWGSYLGWFALVPLLTLARAQARPRHIYWCVYLGGLVFFAPALLWMPVADPRMYATWLMLHLYCAMYFPLSLALIRWLGRRWGVPLLLAVPVVWISLEYFRSWFGSGFSWYLLGHTVQAVLPMIQVADLGGVFAVSFLVAAVNAFLCDVLYQIPAARALLCQVEPGTLDRYAKLEFFNRGPLAELPFRRSLIPEGLALAAVLAAAYGYGRYRLSQNTFEPGPTIALLQGNLDQRLRNEATPADSDAAAQRGADGQQLAARETIAQHYANLCRKAIEFPRPDLIVWPETSYPHEWIEVAADLPSEQVPKEWRDAEADRRDNVRELAMLCPTNHLLGMNANFLDAHARHRRYNSALLLSPQGQVEGKFDKMHRVPFGEYVPLREWLPFMERFAPYEFDYSITAGQRFTRFELGSYRFGVLICYEDTDPYLARHYAVAEEDGPPVDFLINISNDGWFGGSSEHDEHLAVCRFRAIECRRAMARAVNMGISAMIDGNGRVLQPRQVAPGTVPALWSIGDEPGQPLAALPDTAWAGFKKVSGVLKAVIPLDRRTSVYARFGDWLPNGCFLCLGAALLAGRLWRRKPAAA